MAPIPHHEGETRTTRICVCHRCDTPECVNPTHLFLGTMRDNIRDAVAKGRMARGERCKQSALTEDDVRAIRRAWREGETQVEIGRRYGISQPSVHAVVTRKTWAHVLDEPTDPLTEFLSLFAS